jgi:hypothetical protein
MFTHLQQIFGSRMKALEILALLKDVKPVVRHGFYPHELSKVEQFCKKNQLFLEKSPYKVILHDKDIFTNRGKIVNSNHVQGMFFVYMSKVQQKALWTCLYETQQDHKQAGLFLGYPKCCVDYFLKMFAQSNVNPVHTPSNRWTNLTKREGDVCLLSHFPCSNDCDDSILMAQNFFRLLEKYDSKSAHEFSQKLTA